MFLIYFSGAFGSVCSTSPRISTTVQLLHQYNCSTFLNLLPNPNRELNSAVVIINSSNHLVPNIAISGNNCDCIRYGKASDSPHAKGKKKSAILQLSRTKQGGENLQYVTFYLNTVAYFLDLTCSQNTHVQISSHSHHGFVALAEGQVEPQEAGTHGRVESPPHLAGMKPVIFLSVNSPCTFLTLDRKENEKRTYPESVEIIHLTSVDRYICSVLLYLAGYLS